jgi:hypothetical protein
MKITLGIARVIVGTLFVISGLIKANDPHGFSYKLEEYFSVFAQDLSTVKKEVPQELDESIKNSPCLEKLNIKKEYTNEPIPEEQMKGLNKFLVNMVFNPLSKNTLFLAVLICVIEIVLGLFTVIGFRTSLVTSLLFLMIIFFTFLTFYSAYYNKVTDCGCFGDALKLTPWQSFSKDIFLLVFILPLFIFRNRIDGTAIKKEEYIISLSSFILMIVLCILQFKWYFPILFLGSFLLLRFAFAYKLKTIQQELSLLALITIASSLLSYYCIEHLSLKDYRPWKIGNNVRELRASGKAEVSEVEMVYLNKQTCAEVRHSTKEWSWLDSTFEANHLFYKQDKRVIEEAIEPPVKDIKFEDPNTGSGVADSVMNHIGYAFILIAPDIQKTETKNMDRINKIATSSLQNKHIFIGASASSSDQTEEFRHANQNMFTYYINDEKALKTIIRSNPGLVLIKDGVVINKWHGNDIPTWEELSATYSLGK